MARWFILFMGILMIVFGIIYCICYLNLITLGYSFLEYGNFICRRFECLMFPLGLIVVLGIIFIGGDK